MLVIAFSNTEHSSFERKLIKHIVRVMDMDRSVFLEMEQIIKTNAAVESELRWINQSNRPYSEIRPIVDELERRQKVVLTCAHQLIEDELYRYNIHVVLAIKGEPSTWRNFRIVSEVNNIVMFNATQFADQIENSYYLKEMLRNIANENGDETMAVWAGKRSFSKVRPIIYKLSDPTERELIDALIKGV